jgi:hypothetical protein
MCAPYDEGLNAKIFGYSQRERINSTIKHAAVVGPQLS